jgi:hypothetical protein
LTDLLLALFNLQLNSNSFLAFLAFISAIWQTSFL